MYIREMIMKEFQNLVEIMRKLRSPGGCPWDREQTIESLKPYLMEEVYETLEAMDKGGDELKGELGDILLNIIFQALIMEEEGQFNIEDISKNVAEKLVRRHPHVFGNIGVKDSNEVIKNWDAIKKEEKEHKHRKSVLDGVPVGLPPLSKAEKLQRKAAKVGFDWENVEGAIDKMEEELEEMRAAFRNKDMENMKEEMGDVVFSIVNVARLSGINITDALMKTNNKFESRFRYIEENCDIESSDLEKMEKLWQEAKNK
jgi:XTP/dITP diphosphohydrolase/tetrapyrrole methylase family protein/MazG family protein